MCRQTMERRRDYLPACIMSSLAAAAAAVPSTAVAPRAAIVAKLAQLDLVERLGLSTLTSTEWSMLAKERFMPVVSQFELPVTT